MAKQIRPGGWRWYTGIDPLPDLRALIIGVADGFTAGDVETTAAIDSLCNVSSCDGSLLAIQHFGSARGEGRSVVAVVTFHLSGSQPIGVQVVNIRPFNTCTP